MAFMPRNNFLIFRWTIPAVFYTRIASAWFFMVGHARSVRCVVCPRRVYCCGATPTGRCLDHGYSWSCPVCCRPASARQSPLHSFFCQVRTAVMPVPGVPMTDVTPPMCLSRRAYDRCDAAGVPVPGVPMTDVTPPMCLSRRAYDRRDAADVPVPACL